MRAGSRASLTLTCFLRATSTCPVESVRIGGTFAVQPPPMPGAICGWKPRYGTAVQNFPHACCLWAAYTGNSPYRRLLPLEQAAQRWLDEPVGHLEQAIPPEESCAALHGCAVAALFNQVQLSHTGADISCTSLGNEPAGLAASVTMRAITAAYLFSNTLVVLEITEEILRALLERCASYFTLENGMPRVSDAFSPPRWSITTTISSLGSLISFDLRQPVGRRLTRLSRLDGTPFGAWASAALYQQLPCHGHRWLRRTAHHAPYCGAAAWKCLSLWQSMCANSPVSCRVTAGWRL